MIFSLSSDDQLVLEDVFKYIHKSLLIYFAKRNKKNKQTDSIALPDEKKSKKYTKRKAHV